MVPLPLLGEGLNVAVLSVQTNEIYQTCRGRRPDLLRKLTTRENDWILQENIGIVGIKQLYFLIKIVYLSRVVEDVDPYNFKSKPTDKSKFVRCLNGIPREHLRVKMLCILRLGMTRFNF